MEGGGGDQLLVGMVRDVEAKQCRVLYQPYTRTLPNSTFESFPCSVCFLAVGQVRKMLLPKNWVPPPDSYFDAEIISKGGGSDDDEDDNDEDKDEDEDKSEDGQH